MLQHFFIIIYLTTGAFVTSSPAPETSITLQAVPQLLSSIEERLRDLSEVAARVTGVGGHSEQAGVEALSRRIEALESRLGRLDNLIELRLDKLAEAVGGRQIKDELALEQLGRKVDAAAERLNHRLGYLEARLDVAITAKLNAIPQEIQMSLTASEGRLRTELEKLGEKVVPNSGAQSDSGFARWDANEHAQNISRVLKDVLKTGRDKMLESLDIETKNVGIKMSGMCNELWRRSQGLEELVKQSVAISNATQRQVQQVIGDQSSASSDTTELEELGNRLQRRLNDLGRRLDSNFQMMMMTQNMFYENCHRIQLGEPQLEAHLSLVLERMLDTITNRSSIMKDDLIDFRQAVHGQNAQTLRNLALLRNTILQTCDDSKNIAKAIEHLGALTEDGISQVLTRTPTAQAVANFIILDLKPLLLNNSNHCPLPTEQKQYEQKEKMSPPHKEEKLDDPESNSNQTTVDTTLPDTKLAEIEVAETQNLFSNSRGKESLLSSLRNMTLSELLQSIMSSPNAVLEEEQSTEDFLPS